MKAKVAGDAGNSVGHLTTGEEECGQFCGSDIPDAACSQNVSGTINPGEIRSGTITLAPSFGKVTGGGRIGTGPGGLTFAVEAKSFADGVKGGCTVVDHATGTMVKCGDVTNFVRTGTHATFFGNATVNGLPTTYRIDVDDLAEPGIGQDTFHIETGSGYAAGGVLTAGNVQIHSK